MVPVGGSDHKGKLRAANFSGTLNHVSTFGQAKDSNYYDGSVLQEDPEFDDDFDPDQSDDGFPVLGLAGHVDIDIFSLPRTISEPIQELLHIQNTLDRFEPSNKRQKLETNIQAINNHNNNKPSEDRAKNEVTGLLSKLYIHIWYEIFAYLELSSLVSLKCTSKACSSMLMNERIWTRSRKIHHKDLPKPVFGLKEWEMWTL